MLRLTWSMSHDGADLRIDYTITNTGSITLQVVDCLIWANQVLDDAVVIHDAPEQGTVAFTRGIVRTPTKYYLLPPGPTYVELDPMASMTRFAIAPLPLHAWHNSDPMSTALRPDATHAVLEVGYIDHPESRLVQYELPEGRYIGATHTGFEQLIRGERLPFPMLVH
jgi:hypothetical protein